MTNRDPHPWVLQAQVKRWTQASGRNHYQSDPNLLATPALFRLASEAHQIVRVGFAGGPASAGKTERAFRLFISEVPPSENAPADTSGGAPSGVEFLLHILLPVFIPPTQPAPHLQWDLTSNHHIWALQLHNAGNEHVRLIAISVFGASGKELMSRRGLWYVLAGAHRQWPLHVNPVLLHQTLQIRAQSAHTTFKAEIGPSVG